MHLFRRLPPVIAAIAFLIAASVLAVISVGEGIRFIMLREGWFTSTGMRLKRDDASTFFLSSPWIWRHQIDHVKDGAHDSSDTSDTVVTITVCSPVDSLPTIGIQLTSTLSAIQQNPTILQTTSSSDADSSKTGSNEAGSSTSVSSVTASLLGASAFSNFNVTLPGRGSIQTSAASMYQNYLPTVYPTDCQGYIKTNTVTEIQLSTVSDCNVTQFSFIAAFTVTVTANLSTSDTAYTTNSSPVITSTSSTLAIPSLSLPPTGISSSSAVVCPNGALAKRQQDCVSSLAISGSILSSAATSTMFGSLLNSAGSVLASQTLLHTCSDAGSLVNSIQSAVGTGPTSIPSGATTGLSSATA